jgi:hypothetical protein
MASTIVYEPQYKLSGWYDDSGKTPDSWFDRDLSGTVITLGLLQPAFFQNQSIIFTPQPLTVEILPAFYVNPNIFFHPTSVSALDAPDQMLRNEVKRVR